MFDCVLISLVLCDGWVDAWMNARITVQVHRGDTTDPVRQAPQYVPYPSNYRPHLDCLTWIVSILISSPIVLGANYTERRSDGTEVWPRRVSTSALYFGHCTGTEVWPRYRAPVGVADIVYLLQRRLHHLLVNGFVLYAVCGHAVAVLEDLPCHQRSHSP